MVEFRLATATLLPAIVAAIVYLAEKKTPFARCSFWRKQIIIGIVFGIVAVLATEYGIPVDGVVLNVRTAAPLTAGLLFGGPAGIIAGVIGAVERWFSVYWGVGAYTRIACTLATAMAGVFAAILRKYMFDDKKASVTAGFTIGLTTEVLHMLLVFVTNLNDIHTAIGVVQKCAPYMILLNALAVALANGVVKLLAHEKSSKQKEHKQIAQIFRSRLFVCVVAAFVVTCLFTTLLQVEITNESVSSSLEKSIEEVPQRLEGNADSTFLLYSEWIADDIYTYKIPDNAFLRQLAENYVVKQLFIVNSHGEIVLGNIASAIGMTIPDDLILTEEEEEHIGKIETSILDSKTPMQYAAISLGKQSFALIGFDESFIAEEGAKRVETIAKSSHIGRDGFIMVSDSDNIIVSDGSGHEGQTLAEIGIDLDGMAENTVIRATIADTPVRLMFSSLEITAGKYTVIAAIPESEAVFSRNTAIFITAFMEILVFAVLFVNVYFMTKQVVVDNIHKINNSLAKITGGNLNEKVNVRENEEFASLTDDINSTVSTLKDYIAEAAARIDKELEFAKSIQHSAMPSVFPPYPNRKDFDIYALMDTAKEVGGDFYDFYLLDNDRLGFMIADVSGKGIPAAMFMMTAKTVIKGLAEAGMDVNDIFTQANATLCDGNDAGMFVTAWIGILDIRTGLLQFANAGHNPPLIRHQNGSFEFLRTRPNLVLAGMKNTQYKKQEMQLAPGDELFLYTDGVTEAKDAKAQMFREERLLETLNRNPDEGVESRCKNLLAEVSKFVGNAEQFDDITMLSVKLNHLQAFDRIVVYPDMASTDAVWEFIDFKIKRAELPRKLASKLKICTDEVYSNILRYSKATKAEIFCRIDDNLLTLVFRDNGIPYDPTDTKEPDVTLSAKDREIGGLGIFMVKKSVKTLQYEYVDNQNVLTLTFDF